MYEDNFRKALFDALTPEYEKILHDASDDHVFSPKFERKMYKLVKRRNKPYYNLINTLGKRIACIAVIIFVASSVTVLSVKALREAVANFFIDIYEKFSTVQSVDDTDVPVTIEEVYGITSGLDNFKIVYEESGTTWRGITYVNDNQVVNYSQYTLEGYKMNINTEETETFTVDINGIEAICYFDNNDYWNVIWNNGTYIIKISTNISKDALIDMAESVQKVE